MKPNKNSVELTPGNIVDKADMYARMKLRSVLHPVFDTVVALMVMSRHYVLSKLWGQRLSSGGGGHLDPTMTQLVWKSRHNLMELTGRDLGRILYGEAEAHRYRYFATVPPAPVLQDPDVADTPLVMREDLVVPPGGPPLGLAHAPSGLHSSQAAAAAVTTAAAGKDSGHSDEEMEPPTVASGAAHRGRKRRHGADVHAFIDDEAAGGDEDEDEEDAGDDEYDLQDSFIDDTPLAELAAMEVRSSRSKTAGAAVRKVLKSRHATQSQRYSLRSMSQQPDYVPLADTSANN